MDNKIFVFLLTISLVSLVIGQEPCYNYAAFKACKDGVLPELCNLATAAPPPVEAPRSASNCLANGVNVCNKHHCLPPTPAVSTTTCPPPPPARCREGWIKNPKTGLCYKLIFEPIDWYTAKKRCAALEEGASLASIESSDENSFVLEVLKQTNTWSNVWLGGSDLGREGSFVWLDGSRFVYNGFLSGQPDNRYNIEDCVEMLRYSNWRWNDRQCYFQNFALCKNSEETSSGIVITG